MLGTHYPGLGQVSGELADWLASEGYDPASFAPLTGDVSPRRYARLEGREGSTAILAMYPEAQLGTCRRFLKTSQLLESAAIPVPEIYSQHCVRGWMLLEDLGPETLFDSRDRSWAELEPYFATGLELSRRVGALPNEAVRSLNAPMDRELLRRELRQTWEVFLLPRGLDGGASTRRRLGAALDTLCSTLAGAEPVPCHRDFMARNLVPTDPQSGLAVIDHQDLRLGPPWYDLASLLNDSLFPPDEVRDRLLDAALGEDLSTRQDYHRAAAQRTLKAVGTYAAFARRGFDRHLPLIPPTLKRALEHLGELPETRELIPELSEIWGPELGD